MPPECIVQCDCVCVCVIGDDWDVGWAEWPVYTLQTPTVEGGTVWGTGGGIGHISVAEPCGNIFLAPK